MLKQQEGDNLRIKTKSLHGKKPAVGIIYCPVLVFLTLPVKTTSRMGAAPQPVCNNVREMRSYLFNVQL